jgi:hypothetical protein
MSDNSIRSKYLRRLHIYWKDVPKVIPAAGDWYPETTLQCKTLINTPGHNPPGFAFGAKWQYSVSENGVRRRFMAYRMSFYGTAAFEDSNLTVSHLCHNNDCMNPDHHVLEALEVNKARNGCPAGQHCCHKVRCLMPGPYYNA